MDLAHFRFEHDATVGLLSPELALLLVGIAARQAASPTAIVQAKMTPGIPADAGFLPASGSFDDRTATRIRHWKGE